MLETFQPSAENNMAAPIDTALSGDIWHLGIDDLFAPLPDTIRLGGPGPFVINLTTSSAPIGVPAKSIAGCEHAQLYQLQRIEDRRPRYRLRVGPFASEDEADAILKIVRDIFPGALTATADGEDLRALANLQPKAVPPPAVVKPAAAIVPPPRPVANLAAVMAPPPPVLKPAAAIVPPRPVANLAAAMARPVASPPVLTVEQKVSVRAPAAKPPLSVMPAVAAPPVLRVEQKVPMRAPQPKPVVASVPPIKAATPAVPPGPVHKLSTPLPDLESTQTVRALTQLELNDEQASRWFVIQLSLSEDAFDPETVPNLDIFSLYRLYCVAGIDQGRIVHALRLGFFSEEIAASAVASYLAAFYDKPAIKRVSAAERQRFADQSLKARKDVGATGKQAVIEITDERYVRERRIGQAAAKSTRT